MRTGSAPSAALASSAGPSPLSTPPLSSNFLWIACSCYDTSRVRLRGFYPLELLLMFPASQDDELRGPVRRLAVWRDNLSTATDHPGHNRLPPLPLPSLLLTGFPRRPPGAPQELIGTTTMHLFFALECPRSLNSTLKLCPVFLNCKK